MEKIMPERCNNDSSVPYKPRHYIPENYDNCRLCELCHTRCRVVQYRCRDQGGDTTAAAVLSNTDVLWIGEAPGPMENIEGLPFVGPAGRILDDLLDDLDPYFSAGSSCPGMPSFADRMLVHAITNVVCCIPYEDARTREFRPPRESEVNACSPRLASFIDACDPSVIVLLGKVARAHVIRLAEEKRIRLRCPLLAVTHPSYMQRGQNHVGVQAYFEALAVVKTFLRSLERATYLWPPGRIALD